MVLKNNNPLLNHFFSSQNAQNWQLKADDSRGVLTYQASLVLNNLTNQKQVHDFKNQLNSFKQLQLSMFGLKNESNFLVNVDQNQSQEINLETPSTVIQLVKQLGYAAITPQVIASYFRSNYDQKYRSLTAKEVRFINIDEENTQVSFQLHFNNGVNNHWINRLNSLSFNWNGLAKASVQVLGETNSKEVIAADFNKTNIALNLFNKFNEVINSKPSSITAQQLLELNLISSNRSDWKVVNSQNIGQYLNLIPNDNDNRLLVEANLPGNPVNNLAPLKFSVVLDFNKALEVQPQTNKLLLNQTKLIRQAGESSTATELNDMNASFSRKTTYDFVASLVTKTNFNREVAVSNIENKVSLNVTNLFGIDSSGTLWITYTLSKNGVTSGLKTASVTGFAATITNKSQLNAIGSELNFQAINNASGILPSSLNPSEAPISEDQKTKLLQNIAPTNLGTNNIITYTQISGDDATGTLHLSFTLTNQTTTSDVLTAQVKGFLSAQQLVNKSTTSWNIKTDQAATAAQKYPSTETDNNTLLNLLDSSVNYYNLSGSGISITDTSVLKKDDVNGTVEIQYKLSYTLNDTTYTSELKTAVVAGFLSYAKDLEQTGVDFTYTKPSSETRNQNQILPSSFSKESFASSLTATYRDRVSSEIKFVLDGLYPDDATGKVTIFYHKALTVGSNAYVSKSDSTSFPGFATIATALSQAEIIFKPKNTATKVFVSQLTSENWNNFLNVADSQYAVSNVSFSLPNDKTGSVTVKYKVALISTPNQISEEKTATFTNPTDGSLAFLNTQKDAENGSLSFSLKSDANPLNAVPSTISNDNLSTYLNLSVQNVLNSAKSFEIKTVNADDVNGTLTITYVINSGSGDQKSTSSEKSLTVYGFKGSQPNASLRNELNNVASALSFSAINEEYASQIPAVSNEAFFDVNTVAAKLFPTTPDKLEISTNTQWTYPVTVTIFGYVLNFKGWNDEQIENLFNYIANNMYSPVAEAYLNRIEQITHAFFSTARVHRERVAVIRYGNHGSDNDKYQIGAEITDGDASSKTYGGYNNRTFSTYRDAGPNTKAWLSINILNSNTFKEGLLFNFFKNWHPQIYSFDLNQFNFPSDYSSWSFENEPLKVRGDEGGPWISYVFRFKNWTDEQTDQLFSWMAQNLNHPLTKTYLEKIDSLIKAYFRVKPERTPLWYIRIGNPDSEKNQIGGVGRDAGVFSGINANFVMNSSGKINLSNSNVYVDGLRWTMGYKKAEYLKDMKFTYLNGSILNNLKINNVLPPNTELVILAGSMSYNNALGSLTFQAKLIPSLPALTNFQSSLNMGSDLHTYTISGFMDYQTDVNQAQVTFMPKPEITSTLASVINSENYKDYLGDPIVQNFLGTEIGLTPKVDVQIEQTDTPGVIKVITKVSVVADGKTYTAIQPQTIQIGNFKKQNNHQNSNPLLANYEWVGGPRISEINQIRASEITLNNLSDYFRIQAETKASDGSNLYPNTTFTFKILNLFAINNSGLLSVKYKVTIATGGVVQEIERIDFVGVPNDTNPNQHFMTNKQYLDRTMAQLQIRSSEQPVFVNQINEVNWRVYLENNDPNVTYSISDFKILLANPLNGELTVEYKLFENNLISETKTQIIGGFERSNQLFQPLVFNLTNNEIYPSQLNETNWQSYLKHNSLNPGTTIKNVRISDVDLSAGSLRFNYQLSEGQNLSTVFSSIIDGFKQADIIPSLSKSDVSVPLGNNRFRIQSSSPLAIKPLGNINNLSDLLAEPLSLFSPAVQTIWGINDSNINNFVILTKDLDNGSITLKISLPAQSSIGVQKISFSQTYSGFFNFTSEWKETTNNQIQVSQLSYEDFEALKQIQANYLQNPTTNVEALKSFLDKLNFGVYYSDVNTDDNSSARTTRQNNLSLDTNLITSNNDRFIYDLSKIEFTDDFNVVFNPNSIQAVKHYQNGVEITNSYSLTTPLKFSTMFNTPIYNEVINDISIIVGVPIGVLGGLMILILTSWFISRAMQVRSSKLSIEIAKKRY